MWMPDNIYMTVHQLSYLFCCKAGGKLTNFSITGVAFQISVSIEAVIDKDKDPVTENFIVW